jgi:hypothetical protein
MMMPRPFRERAATVPGLLLLLTALCTMTFGFSPSPSGGGWRRFLKSSVTTANPSPAATTTTQLYGILGNMFGGSGGGNSNSDTAKETAVLGTFDISTKDSSSSSSNIAFESLSDYIQNKWAPLFVNGNIKLTTPVVLELLSSSSSSSSSSNKEEDVEVASGVRLLFRKVNTGYQSKQEEEESGGYRSKDDDDDEKKKDKKKDQNASHQGGVEILVEKVKGSSGHQVRVRAQRCDFDEDTMIKEMSEETILRELQTAIDVWKKDSSA